MRPQQGFDHFPGSPAEEWEMVADRRVFGADARAGPGLCRRADIELTVDHNESASRSEDADPLVDGRLRVRERPEQMTADGEVEAACCERKLLGVGLLEPDGRTALRRLAPCCGEHRRGEVDRRDAMAATGKFKREESGAATRIERVEDAAGREDEIEDAVPGGALGRRADAMAEVFVEVRRSPLPVSGDLLLDDVMLIGGHGHSPSSFAADGRADLVMYVA